MTFLAIVIVQAMGLHERCLADNPNPLSCESTISLSVYIDTRPKGRYLAEMRTEDECRTVLAAYVPGKHEHMLTGYCVEKAP